MTSALTYPHIEKVAGQPARLQRIPRVRVAQIVMDYLAYGWSVEEMCRQHPYLMQSEAHAAMAYYFDFQAEIEQEIRTEWEQVQQEKSLLSPSPFFVRMRAKGLLKVAIALYVHGRSHSASNYRTVTPSGCGGFDCDRRRCDRIAG